MTNSIEDRLRAALHDAPPVDARPVPLEEIKRGARRRQGLVAIAAAAAVALVAVLGVSLSMPGSGRHSAPPVNTPTPTPATQAQRWVGHDIYGVAHTPDGRMWVVQRQVSGSKESWFIRAQNADGTLGASIRVSHGPVTQLVAQPVLAGAGQLWTFGGGDGAYPNGWLNSFALDSQAGGPTTWGPFHHAGINGLAFVNGVPYIALWGANRVEIPQFSTHATPQVSLPGSPTEITATGNGQLWVRVDTPQGPKLQQILLRGAQRPQPTRLALGSSFGWRGPILGADRDHSDAIWTTDSRYRIIELSPSTMANGSASLAYVGDRLPVPGQAIRVIEDAAGGLYVAVNGGWRGAKVGIAYFDPQARHNGSGGPTAFLPSHSTIRAIAADPNGGVVFTDSSSAEFHWDPTAH